MARPDKSGLSVPRREGAVFLSYALPAFAFAPRRGKQDADGINRKEHSAAEPQPTARKGKAATDL